MLRRERGQERAATNDDEADDGLEERVESSGDEQSGDEDERKRLLGWKAEARDAPGEVDKNHSWSAEEGEEDGDDDVGGGGGHYPTGAAPMAVCAAGGNRMSPRIG